MLNAKQHALHNPDPHSADQVDRGDNSVVCMRRMADSKRAITNYLVLQVPMQVPFGQSVGLVGSLEAVGKWKTANALTLTWGQDDVWSGDVEVPAG